MRSIVHPAKAAGLVLLLVVAGLVAAPASAGTSPASAAAAADVVVDGRGWGHGRGMSQWGAQGQALADRSYAQIISFYYPGDSLSTRAERTIRVRVGISQTSYVLSGMTGATLTSASGTRFTWTGRGDEIRVTSSGSTVVLWQRSGSAWVQASTPGWAPGGSVTAANGATVGLRRTDGGLTSYRGALRVHAVGSGRADLLSVLPAEQYLYSVVAAEMPSYFAPAALQAQAVAARSYAQFPCSGGRTYYDVEATTACQVYRGYSSTSPGGTVTGFEAASVRSAVDATRDRVVLRNGSPVRTEFSSSNGGWTAASNGWPAKSDPYDDDDSRNANSSWTTRVPVSLIQQRWPQIGTFVRFGETARSGGGPFGGRIVSQQVVGTAGTVTVTGDALRTGLGLKSTLVAFRTPPPDVRSELVLNDAATGRLVVVRLDASGRASTSLSDTSLPGYDVVVPVDLTRSAGTELLLYGTGDRRAAALDIDATGRVSSPLFTSTWSRWDHVVPIEVDGTPGSELLLYHAGTGRQVVMDLDADGRPTTTLSQTTWSRWDVVVPVEVDGTAGSELLLYNTTTGRQTVVDLSRTGMASRPLSETTWSAWDVVVPVEVDGTAGSELIVYNSRTGRQAVVDLSATGRASRPLSETTWSMWDTVVPVELDGTAGSELVLYDTRSRRMAAVDLSPLGRASRSLSEATWARWSSVVPVQLP